MTASDVPPVPHQQSKMINTVVLRSYLKEISPLSLTTFPLPTLNERQGTAASQNKNEYF